MNQDKRRPYCTRAAIMKLLSDAEVAQVSNAEAMSLANGDEYIDLEKLGDGVQRAAPPSPPTKNTLARKSVESGTWDAILAKLAESHVPASQAQRPRLT